MSTTTTKNNGEMLDFVCSTADDQCTGTMYNYFFYNDTSEEAELIHQGTYRHNVHINRPGVYCCVKQCSDTMPADSQCCIQGKYTLSVNQH